MSMSTVTTDHPAALPNKAGFPILKKEAKGEG